MFRAALPILSALALATPALAELPLHQQIDAHIQAGSETRLAEVSDDAEFFRRVNLDFAGVIPSVGELQAFLTDPSPLKRQSAIGTLINGPQYAQTMRDRFHIHLMERRGDNPVWLAWLEASFAKNKPWDQMANEIIRADFRDEPNRGAAFFHAKRLEKSGQQPTDFPGLTRDVGRMFLGMDLQCAECHNHLLIDDYNQVDFQGLMAGFSKLKLLRKDYPAVEEQLMTEKHHYASVFTGKPREVGPKVPGLDEIELIFYPQKEEQYEQQPDRKTQTPGIPRFSPLQNYADRIPRAPTFSTNLVNRVWFLMMGRGLIEPLDQIHSMTPSSHPKLLSLLATEFERRDFNLKWLLHELALTKTYQRTTRLPVGRIEVADERFVTALERRLSSEQLLASTLRAICILPENAPLENVKPDANDPGSSEIPGLLERFREAFDSEPKEPELQFAPSLKSALFAMNDPEIAKLLQREDALPTQLAVEEDDEKLATTLFLHVYSRLPSKEESSDVITFLASSRGSRAQGIADITWAMLTSTEFLVNH